MKSLKQLTEMVLEFRQSRDWEKFHTPKDLALSLMVEAAEVGETFQWKSAQDIQNNIEQIKTKVGAELADVLYAALLLSHDLGIDLEESFRKKMRENERKYPVESFKGSNRKYSE